MVRICSSPSKAGRYEAHAAEVVTNAGRTVPASVVGYDHDTGFGLLRTLEPLKIKPLLASHGVCVIQANEMTDEQRDAVDQAVAAFTNGKEEVWHVHRGGVHNGEVSADHDALAAPPRV